ncbi:MAG: hypothetical protein HeimC3_24070 [Candidatus Heimdallarchaeota archaeon LC_3]|nr:MAG: hypothetical protein HeimC3_24070 [Candidatus Heimdallarchaeota archaeon LC_3]
MHLLNKLEKITYEENRIEQFPQEILNNFKIPESENKSYHGFSVHKDEKNIILQLNEFIDGEFQALKTKYVAPAKETNKKG